MLERRTSLLAEQEETALVMEVSEIHGLLYLPSPRNRVLAKTGGIPLSPPTLFEICITHVDRTQVVSKYVMMRFDIFANYRLIKFNRFISYINLYRIY
jgi:hypothetical protein